MTFELTILGSNSAIPANGRHPTAQLLDYNNCYYLLDCGEGTQMRLDGLHIKRSRIDHIFISHLHGDHYFGLVGLITSYHLLGREKPVHIYCPKGLDEIIRLQLGFSSTELQYELNFHFLDFEKNEVILDNTQLTVETILMRHRIPCTGFLFREKQLLRHIIPEKITEHNIPFEQIPGIKAGNDFINSSGKLIKNDLLTTPAPEPRSYAYCTDTIFSESIITQIKGVSLLYHEATFTDESKTRAADTMHTTAKEAATIALKSEVKKLLIGHFSAKYKSLENHLAEAREIFPETYLAEEGLKFEV